jgi:prepilin-type N-terminal cleavage/methylation domain-containing protein
MSVSFRHKVLQKPAGKPSLEELGRSVYAAPVAQTSKPAVSRVSQPATCPNLAALPIWKSAIQQVWKPALRKASHSRGILAFTLIELLVVIAIIGLLLTLGMPMIKGLNKSNSMIAADRQLLDDINYARQRAIADHTSVYMVFIPPNIITWTLPPNAALSKAMVNLYAGQYNTYALLSLRSVGEQPGRITPRYLTPWRSLPAGVYIATNKLTQGAIPGLAPTFFNDLGPKKSSAQFPFPVATNFASTTPGANGLDYHLPHFGFNYLGQVIYRSNGVDNLVFTQSDSSNHMYIPLARGSLFYQRNTDGTYAQQPPDISEMTAGSAYYTTYSTTNAAGGVALPSPDNLKSYNQIYIDPLTGRAKVQRLQIQ